MRAHQRHGKLDTIVAGQKCIGRLCSGHSERPKSAVLSRFSWLVLQMDDEGLGVPCCLASGVAPSTPFAYQVQTG